MELVAARPSSLETRHEQVDEALGLAQLGGRHPVELAVAQDLALRVGVGRDHHALDRRLVVAVFFALGRHRRTALVGTHLPAFGAGFRDGRAGRLLVERGVVWGAQRGRLEFVGEARATLAPPAIECGVVDRPIVTTADEDRRAGRLHLLAIGDVDEGQRPREVDRRAEVDREARHPQRPPEADRLAEQAPTVDLGPERRADDGRVVVGGSVGQRASRFAVSRPRPPRTGIAASPRHGPGGCPPRT